MSWNNHLQNHQPQQPQQYQQQSYHADHFSQNSNQIPKYQSEQDTLSFSSDSSRGYIDQPVNSWPAWTTESSPENQAVPSQINNFNMDMYSRQPVQWNPQQLTQPISMIPQQPQFFTRTRVEMPPPSFLRNENVKK